MVLPMIEAPQTGALHPKQLDMSWCCFMKKRLFMPSDALPGKEPLGCSTRLGSCFFPLLPRIITMRRWGNNFGLWSQRWCDVTVPHRCPEREWVCIQGCMVNRLPSHSLFFFQCTHLLGGLIVVFPGLYTAPRMTMTEPKVLPYISV